jgi:phage terminase large subunit GpA-like protein
MTEHFSESDMRFLRYVVDMMPCTPPPKLISEYVEGRRNLPISTPIPGLWHNSVSPYLVEIMDNMSPFSPVQKCVVMKPRKVGMTTGAENVVGYWIGANPAEILYTTASDDLALDWATQKLPPLLRSLKIQDRITANSESAKSRRSGDSTYRKEYSGGALDIVSSRSLMARRALDKRVLIIDEVDGLPAMTTTGEGNWVEILIGHTISFGERRKILMFSSPTTIDSSNILPYFNAGDKRHFFVPCPVCGHLMELRTDYTEMSDWGLKADTTGGHFNFAYYVCEFCHEPIMNEQKSIMYSDDPHCIKYPDRTIEKYQWIPQKVIDDVTLRSYWMNALYSPIGMLSFSAYWKEEQKAKNEGAEAVRSFTNLYQGLPYKDTGFRPKLNTVLRHRGEYASGEIPNGILYLTAGIDVQQGSSSDKRYPERLEMEIMGHGAGYRTWSVCYKIFHGSTTDPYSGAWEKLNEFAESGGLSFTRDDGMQFDVKMVFIDSGDAADGRSEIVYRFCQRWENTFPVKGFGNLVANAKRREKGDVPGPGNFKKYRPAAIGSAGDIVYEISTNHYKGILYNNLNVDRIASDIQPPGYADFPRDYPDEYFAQLTGTEKYPDGSFHDVRERVEALDCRVYALCAGDVWIDNELVRIRKVYRDQGATMEMVDSISTKNIIDALQEKCRRIK